MKIYSLSSDAKTSALPQQATAVALGRFDGVHIGHKALISAMVSHARNNQLIPLVWMINCTCRDRCNGEGCKGQLLTNTSEKLELFRQLGVEYAVVENFADICHLSPDEFINKKLHNALGCCAAFCGENFRYGKGAEGTPSALAHQMADFGGQVFVTPFVTIDNEIVSSTAIRTALSCGDMSKAATMLGREYSISGNVIHGQKLGRKLGFPTANILYPKEKFTLPYGVYRSCFETGSKRYPAVTNIGIRPSVGGEQVLVESHLFEFSQDLYNQNATLYLHEFIRPERRFNSMEELESAIATDIAVAREGWGM